MKYYGNWCKNCYYYIPPRGASAYKCRLKGEVLIGLSAHKCRYFWHKEQLTVEQVGK